MPLNPFKDSNLENLQEEIIEFLSSRFGFIIDIISEKKDRLVKKGKERITIMLIPHSEKKIVNFHIPLYSICLIISLLVITIIITSVAIINHTSTIKDVSKLKMYGVNSKIQIEKYKAEINKLHETFQKLKPELTYLYSLTDNNDVDSLWAKGGGTLSDLDIKIQDLNTPSLEVLNIEEVEQELKTTKEVLEKIKSFMDARKKIIENTPSLWPSEGYIISNSVSSTSPYTFKNEFQKGIEIASFPGSIIRSTAPGKVENISWDPVLGLNVTITHKYGFSTRYSHCQRILVEEEQKVSKGEAIANVGRTGKAARHVCFYQIKIGTEYVDPIPYLNKLSN